MSNIKSKISFFENIIDKNKTQSKKNQNCDKTINKSNVKKKVSHWNKIRKKYLNEEDMILNDSLIIKNDNNNNKHNDDEDDDDDVILLENSIIN